jgi:ABC-type xylose transport system permease subunit
MKTSDLDIRRIPRCSKCGYILIGLLERRCPECGTPFEHIVKSTKTHQQSVGTWIGVFLVYLSGIAVVVFLRRNPQEEVPEWLDYVSCVVLCSPLIVVALLVDKFLANYAWARAVPWIVLVILLMALLVSK